MREAIKRLHSGTAPWLDKLAGSFGENEKMKNGKANPSITGLVGANVDPTGVPWCGSAAAAAMKHAGIAPPQGAAWAGSWRKWGQDGGLKVGDVYHIQYPGEGSGGHVTTVLGVSKDGSQVFCLGGNQNDGLNISAYPAGEFEKLQSLIESRPAKKTTSPHPSWITMQTHRVSASCQASHAKALACLCVLAWMPLSASAAEPIPLTTTQLETLMLPPVGWKVDQGEIQDHLWMVAALDADTSRLIVYPFWPAYISLALNEDMRVTKRFPGYHGVLGELLKDALDSPDLARKKRAELWLRQCFILYFTGFRLSKFFGEGEAHRPYAPWIKPEDARRLDQVADQYLARQRVLIHSGMHPEEISDREAARWLSKPGGTSLSAVYGYFDAVGATHDYLPLTFIYPINWTWTRNRGNQTLTPAQGFGDDLSHTYTGRLIGSELPDSNTPLSLWLRDVYLSYIAGKELFESKLLPAADNDDGPRVKEAVQLWWKHTEKQK